MGLQPGCEAAEAEKGPEEKEAAEAAEAKKGLEAGAAKRCCVVCGFSETSGAKEPPPLTHTPLNAPPMVLVLAGVASPSGTLLRREADGRESYK